MNSLIYLSKKHGNISKFGNTAGLKKMYTESELKDIYKAYQKLEAGISKRYENANLKRIKYAFDIALDAHKDMDRKSGEKYIYHPLAVSRIVSEEIGLGEVSIICALLHDTVEDTEITIEDIRREFGEVVANIIEGLTKINKIAGTTVSAQAENFRKILLSLSSDIRIILIKLADRLHNMRTLAGVPESKQRKTASETRFLYAPLAHRLGMHQVKSELEDLSLKYLEKEVYQSIARDLNETKVARDKYIREFIKPIRNILKKNEVEADVFGRPKTIYSIWKKMTQKNLPLSEVYDQFAIRIIPKLPPREKGEPKKAYKEKEADICWKILTWIIRKYPADQDRLRDWVTQPKSNGYESLHITVMGPEGRWVEVQIRTERMNEVAERGLAAHWKYKEKDTKYDKKVFSKFDQAVENWIDQARELLQNQDGNPVDFVDDFKLQLYSREMYVFTPKGETLLLPQGSTPLDFAFAIHSDVGKNCLGAKVGGKLVPLNYELKRGDQVEIITSKNQKPSEDWLKMVVTSRAKSRIKSFLKEDKKNHIHVGKELLERKLKQLKITFDEKNIQFLTQYFESPETTELYYQIGIGKVELNKIKDIPLRAGYFVKDRIDRSVVKKIVPKKKSKNNSKKNLITFFNDSSSDYKYEFATCCSPIPGDEIFGFVTTDGGIKIHRTNCKNAVNLYSRYDYRIVETKWTDPDTISALTAIKIQGIDDVGTINKMTNVISGKMKINMQSMSIESKDKIFEGTIHIYIKNNKELDNLIEALLEVDDIYSVSRLDE